MKRIGLLLVLVVLFAFRQAEKYYVTFVSGPVTDGAGKTLKVGDVLQASTKLVFKNAQAKVSCISPGKGRFDLTAAAAKPAAGGELVALLKDNLVPANKTYHLSTRAVGSEGYDPKTYFSAPETNDRVLLVDGMPLPISSSYPLNAQNFFFVQADGVKPPIIRKVPVEGNRLLFSRELFRQPDGAVYPGKVVLCYQSNATGKPYSMVVAEFVPVLAGKDELAAEVKMLRDHAGTTNEKSMTSEVMGHLFGNYGKIGEGEVAALEK